MSSCFSRCLRVPIAIRAFYESYLWILQTLLLTHPDLHPGLLETLAPGRMGGAVGTTVNSVLLATGGFMTTFAALLHACPGEATRMHTVDAVRALDKAISASSNYSEFFQALTSNNLMIVVEHGFMQKWPLCADCPTIRGHASNPKERRERFFGKRRAESTEHSTPVMRSFGAGHQVPEIVDNTLEAARS
ncbi:MAG: hypothetical protein WB762_17030, partial [Candidatus Sulfotelmatobacter sp.]